MEEEGGLEDNGHLSFLVKRLPKPTLMPIFGVVLHLEASNAMDV